MKDHLVRILTKDGSLRGVAAVTTRLTEEICSRQGTDPVAAVALGRLVTGAALMGSLLKAPQRVALMVEANGPLKKLHAEADAFGRVRGSVKEPLSGVQPTPGNLKVAEAVGRAGFLHVIKDLGLKDPYRGMVQLQTSEIATDLAYYFTTSEQTPSTVALGVYVEPEGRVSAAGGFLLQMLPDGDETMVPLLEERLSDLPPSTTLVREGKGATDILERIFEGIPFSVIQKTDLAFHCGCSRDQVGRMLLMLGKEEFEELKREEETLVTCEFCKETYVFTRKELESLKG